MSRRIHKIFGVGQNDRMPAFSGLAPRFCGAIVQPHRAAPGAIHPRHSLLQRTKNTRQIYGDNPTSQSRASASSYPLPYRYPGRGRLLSSCCGTGAVTLRMIQHDAKFHPSMDRDIFSAPFPHKCCAIIGELICGSSVYGFPFTLLVLSCFEARS